MPPTPSALLQLSFDMAHCIAIGEGYPAWTKLPYQQRNPGDLTHSPQGTPQPNGKCKYASHSAGWQDLEAFCLEVLAGKHPLYPPTMTILEFATKYTGGKPSPGWLYPITAMLAAHLDETLEQFAARKTATPNPDAR